MDLLGGSSSDSDSSESSDLIINTNNEYASNYDKWRGKEHLQKLKDKHGDQSIDLEDEDEDESSSEEEDEDGGEITAEMEKDFFATLSSLKSKDPAIYDGETTFFKPIQQTANKPQAEKKEKLTIADMERKIILEKGGQFDEIEAEEIVTHTEEMKSIKESFKTALESEEEDEEEDFLMKRKKDKEEVAAEEEDYKKWLAGQEVEVANADLKEKMKGLKEFWNVKNLDDGEKFLKDYILNKRYLDNDDEEYVPSYDDVVHDSDEDLSEDEKNVVKQEEFEHKFNFRFEEPDEEFIKRYPRTIKGSLRKTDDKRKLKRKEVEERKKHEKKVKKEEIKMLKSMKKKEIMQKLEQLKKITGNEEMDLNEDDIEGDFNPEEYDKKMAEIFKNYDDNVEDDEKPTFSDLDDDYEDDYGEDFEDWDNWTSEKQQTNTGVEQAEEEEEALHCEDENFNMDCDFQQELVESTKKKKGRRKSKFAKALEDTSAKPVFDPTDKTFSEYVDEYYKLDCEDLIGDMPCRFQYRTVQPNDFGLSVEEVLSAEDKELNAWVSLRKTCQYRPEEEERKDFHVYRNKSKDAKLKRKVLPSLFEEPEAAVEEANSKKDAGILATGKKRRRAKKKNKSASNLPSGDQTEEPPTKKARSDPETTEPKESTSSESSNRKKKKNKKNRKLSNQSQQPQKNSVIQVNKISAAFTKKTENREIKATTNQKSGDLLKFSDDRLKAYGVNPSQFKRKVRAEKFKVKAVKRS